MKPSLINVKHLHIHLPPITAVPSTALHAEPANPAHEAAPPPLGRFTLSGGSIDHPTMVTDHRTGLMWSAVESAERMNFDGAERYCAELRTGDFDDWHLPDLEELESIRDLTRHEPCLDTSVFKSHSSWVWSRTPTAWSPDYAWIVAFYYGNVSGNHRDYSAFVRAVRRVSPAGQ